LNAAAKRSALRSIWGEGGGLLDEEGEQSYKNELRTKRTHILGGKPVVKCGGAGGKEGHVVTHSTAFNEEMLIEVMDGWGAQFRPCIKRRGRHVHKKDSVGIKRPQRGKVVEGGG